jgi:muramoyltetrapeptide carboxypeptidase LdcA involved in peptidoglycan recycling
MKKIKVEISPADFLDRLSILNIKLENFSDEKKKKIVRQAKVSLFVGNLDQFNTMNDDIYVRKMYLALQEVNKEIWVLEDIVRNQEDVSLETYRSITSLNDARHRIKSKIDSHLGSSIGEEKGYK